MRAPIACGHGWRGALGFSVENSTRTVGGFAKAAFPLRRQTVDTPIGKFWIDPVSNLGHALRREGTYEPGMRAVLESFLGPGKVFVDLGANEGYFTVLAARLTQPRGRVLAVEPQARLIPIIETNLRINKLDATIIHAAVSDHRGAVTLHLAYRPWQVSRSHRRN
jgi:hypothetical protein